MNATCPTCDTRFIGVDRNEDGSPYIESTRCAHPGCAVYLCRATCQELSFVCDGCRSRFCGEHPVFTVDTDHFCAACLQELQRAMLAEAGCTLEEVATYVEVGRGR